MSVVFAYDSLILLSYCSNIIHVETIISMLKVVQKLVMGGMSGVAAKTVVSPLERVRILAQTTSSYKGNLVLITRDVMKKEGLAGDH